jgi:3-hydroxyisobutyrate dehydrogenase
VRYGFIGLGVLGSKLAGSLLRNGFAVRAFDLDPGTVEGLAGAGAEPAVSAAAAARGVDGLITCLPSPAASAAALLGEDGALAAMEPGSTWIEMSTTNVAEIKRIAGIAAGHGIATLEAPVTGGVHRAATGEITVLVGGPGAVLAAHRPALEAMGGPIFHMGDLGAASLLKVITNMLAFIDLIAAGEALMLAKRGGLDLARCYEAICASSGYSREFEDWAPAILSGSFNTGFTIALGCKDLGFVVDLGRDLGVPLKLAGLVEQLFTEACEKYGGDAWTPHVIKMMEDATGTELRATGIPEALGASGR